MDTVKYKYEFECINCSVPFTFYHKSDAIETATCPCCKQDKQFPKNVSKIEQFTRSRSETTTISHLN